MRVLSRRRDPWWDLDGRSARRERTNRRVLGFVVVVLAATLLALILARLPAVDVHELVTGPRRTVIVGVLLADVAACLLLVAGRMREAVRV
jgi:hypothetical protein